MSPSDDHCEYSPSLSRELLPPPAFTIKLIDGSKCTHGEGDHCYDGFGLYCFECKRYIDK